MLKEPKVSIIVPFIEMDSFVEQCIEHCLELDYKNFEIILLPDSEIKANYPKTRVIPTGHVHPSVKRNIGIKKSDAEIIASIDSDAYPWKNWLKEAVKIFEDPDVGAVGGPNLPYPNAGIMEKAAVSIVYSNLGLGKAHMLGKKEYKEGTLLAKELASSNFIYKKSVLDEIHGYESPLPTGEDTLISNKIRATGKKLIYSPKVVVHHHRRPLFMPHLTRIAKQAIDKAIIVRKKISKENLIFFLPPLFVLGLVSGFIFSYFSEIILVVYLVVMGIYLLLVMNEARKTTSFRESFLILIGIPLTHIFYGLGFLGGLLIPKRRKKLPI